MPTANDRPVLKGGEVHLDLVFMQEIADNTIFWDGEKAVTVPNSDIEAWMSLDQKMEIPVAFLVQWYADKINRKRMPTVDRAMMVHVEEQCKAIGVELPEPDPEPEEPDSKSEEKTEGPAVSGVESPSTDDEPF